MKDLSPTQQASTALLDLPDDFQRAFKLIREAYPRLEYDEFVRMTKLAQSADGYRMIGRETRQGLVALMGYRILHTLAYGSFMQIDDLFVATTERKKGHAAELLRYAETESRRLGLAGLRLQASDTDSGVMEFMTKEHWVKESGVFVKAVSAH